MKELSFNELRDFKDSICRKRERMIKMYLLRQEREILSRRRKNLIMSNDNLQNRYVGHSGDNLDDFFEENTSFMLEKKD